MKSEDQQKRNGSRNAKVGAGILLALAIIPLVMEIDLGRGAAAAEASTAITWVDLEEGVRLSQTSGKKILVDVYTDWCTWCKKMDADVYTSSAVREQISRHFIPVKLNAESNEQVSFNGSTMTKAQFSQAAGVTGFPSTLFLTPQQEPITLVPGFIPAERFSAILEFIGADHYTTTSFESFLAQRPGS